MLRAARDLGYYAGSRWFQAAVAAGAVALLAVCLLEALERELERVEKVTVEMAVRNMRTGMRLAMAEVIMHGRTREIHSWIGANPVRWLEGALAGYRGECSVDEAGRLPPGSWCFDVGQHEVVYRPRRQRYLVVLSTSAGSGEKQLRWRVGATDDRKENEGLMGLEIATVSPYTWKIE